MYTYTVNLACANRAAALANIWTQLVAMGWTLVDNQDGSNYRVYSSPGESGTEPIGYVKIDSITANKIQQTAYYYWNATTHVGYGAAYGTQITTSESGFFLWVYGDKNFVYVDTKVSGAFTWFNFGHIQNRFWTVQTTLTSPAVSGSSVSLVVASSANFKVGQSYQIYGVAAEGRDWVQVTSIPDGTHLVVASLPRNYGTNTIIGQLPSVFGGSGSAFSTGLTQCEASPSVSVGTATAATTYAAVTSYSLAGDNIDTRANGYIAQPLVFVSPSAPATSLGYLDTYFLSIPHGTQEDTVDIGRQDSGTATSGGVNTLDDTSKNWTVNAFAGKTVTITFGLGLGQIMKIASNTATEIVLVNNWGTAPDSTSKYVISDEGYRVHGSSGNRILCREGV